MFLDANAGLILDFAFKSFTCLCACVFDEDSSTGKGRK